MSEKTDWSFVERVIGEGSANKEIKKEQRENQIEAHHVLAELMNIIRRNPEKANVVVEKLKELVEHLKNK